MKKYGLLFALAACGGGGGGGSDDSPDAATAIDGARTPDAEGCALPASVVVAHGGTVSSAYVDGLNVRSNGDIDISSYDAANGENVISWDGTAWTTHSVFTNTNGGFGGRALTEADGKAAYIATPSDPSTDSDRMRLWLQLAAGSFASPERVDPGNVTMGADFARYSSTTEVLAVEASQFAKTVMYYERNAQGVWTPGTIDYDATSNEERGAGIGELTDHTAVAGVHGDHGFQLFRRTGQSWGLYKTLDGSVISDAHIVFPPEGSEFPDAVAIYRASNGTLRGMMVSRTDGTATGAGDLQTGSMDARDSEVVFNPDGTGGKILAVNDNFNNPQAWIIPFEGTSFGTAQEVRPDLVFDAYPHLMYHSCGGYLILHVARATTDQPGSEDAVLEPLDTFAPGL